MEREKSQEKEKQRYYTFKHILHLFTYYFAYVCLCVCHDKTVEVRGQFAGIGSIYMGSRDRTQVVKLGDKCPHLLNPAFVFRLERRKTVMSKENINDLE